MKGLMGFIGATIASAVGGYLAKMLGMELFGQFMIGSIAGGFGMYYGIKSAKRNFG